MKIIITRATSGIGRQLALDYANLDHQVWALGRNEQTLEELRSQGLQTGQVDLGDRSANLAWFTALDSIDLAILNAGTCEYIDMPEFDSRLVQRVMRANAESLAISIEAVMSLAKERIDVSLICRGFVKTRLTDLNDFPMPFRITPQEASDSIRKGLARKKVEIHFPKRFTNIFKLLSYLPRPVWNKIAERMVK